jgi:hypothetical protein
MEATAEAALVFAPEALEEVAGLLLAAGAFAGAFFAAGAGFLAETFGATGVLVEPALVGWAAFLEAAGTPPFFFGLTEDFFGVDAVLAAAALPTEGLDFLAGDVELLGMEEDMRRKGERSSATSQTRQEKSPEKSQWPGN